nr:MAG TPA: hypothetical protein [Caudoviricetes sp.]
MRGFGNSSRVLVRIIRSLREYVERMRIIVVRIRIRIMGFP